jgi:hypothetical protein
MGTLMLAMEGNELHLGLHSPAMNLIGFEHRPADGAQRQQIEQARKTLKQGSKMFVINPEAECTLQEARVDSDLFGDAKDHAHEADEHDGHEDHDEHGHDEHEGEERHADIEAEYHFACAEPEALKTLRLALFEAFPTTQRIKVIYFTDQGQGAQHLTPEQPLIQF